MRMSNPCSFLARYQGVKKNSIRALNSFARFTTGELGTDSYRIFFTDEKNKKISPWHDIPLRTGGTLFNYINEIPKNTRAKMEIATRVKNNPIAQDIKNGKPRFYHGPIYWNYGCFPQTWEDPGANHPDLVSRQICSRLHLANIHNFLTLYSDLALNDKKNNRNASVIMIH